MRTAIPWAVLVAAGAGALHAGTITLGSSAGFADGSTNARVSTWNTAVAGNPAPFNAFNGSDVSGPNFSATWQFNYAPLGSPVTSATLTIGIYDLDSAATGNQIFAFMEGSNDLTSLLNTVAEGLHSGTGAVNNEYDILTINLPSSTFADLQNGTPSFTLTLQGPGLGTLGATTSNGAGIDFSTLNTDISGPTPEPSTWILSAGGLLSVVLLRRFRRA